MRIALADDSLLFREGLARLLTERGFDIAGQATDADGLLTLVDAEAPDMAIIDIRMPPEHRDEGLVAARAIRDQHPTVGVLVLSQYVEVHYALRLVEDRPRGAGYLLKDRVEDLDEFTTSVRRVAAGELVVDPSVVSLLVSRSRVHDPLDELTARHSRRQREEHGDTKERRRAGQRELPDCRAGAANRRRTTPAHREGAPGRRGAAGESIGLART